MMVVSTIRRSASALRKQYLTSSAYSANVSAVPPRTAVVVGATSGIGEACAHRLAEQGYLVVAVGRDKPGRAQGVVSTLTEKSRRSAAAATTTGTASSEIPIPKHEFRPCDAFSLKSVDTCTASIVKDHECIDALVMTQGMATIQGFTPTAEGNDQKLTLHYWSRVAFANGLLPSLRRSRVPHGPVVLTVLSGGVHAPYANYEQDPELKKRYSIKNAADAAGFYNDLGFDALALRNPAVHFVHSAPGFVNTNWGAELPFYIKGPTRVLQSLLARSAGDCAEYMLGPTVFASLAGDGLPDRPDGKREGVRVMGDKGQSAKLTKLHTDEAREFVWGVTVDVLKRAGIEMN